MRKFVYMLWCWRWGGWAWWVGQGSRAGILGEVRKWMKRRVCGSGLGGRRWGLLGLIRTWLSSHKIRDYRYSIMHSRTTISRNPQPSTPFSQAPPCTLSSHPCVSPNSNNSTCKARNSVIPVASVTQNNHYWFPIWTMLISTQLKDRTVNR